MPTRAEVYAAIDTERDYQDAKWGAHGSDHEIPSWLTYMRSYLDEATDQVSRSHGDGGALDTLRKVVALGVRCLEEHGAPSRRLTRRTIESIMADPADAPPAYGYCPGCGARGERRERRPDGNDTCLSGHVYPSRDATAA